MRLLQHCNTGGVWHAPYWPYLYWGEPAKALMQAELLAEDWSFARLDVNGWPVRKPEAVKKPVLYCGCGCNFEQQSGPIKCPQCGRDAIAITAVMFTRTITLDEFAKLYPPRNHDGR